LTSSSSDPRLHILLHLVSSSKNIQQRLAAILCLILQLSINQSKHIYVAQYVVNKLPVHIVCM